MPRRFRQPVVVLLLPPVPPFPPVLSPILPIPCPTPTPNFISIPSNNHSPSYHHHECPRSPVVVFLLRKNTLLSCGPFVVPWGATWKSRWIQTSMQVNLHPPRYLFTGRRRTKDKKKIPLPAYSCVWAKETRKFGYPRRWVVLSPPSCACGVAEETGYHLVFHCQRFEAIRTGFL